MSKKNREKRAHKKQIPMTPVLREVIEMQLQAFREKFHREARAEDPIFFDPDADTPQVISEEKMRAMMVDIAHEANLTPDIIYAMRKPGWVVTEGNKHLLTSEEAAEWNDAIDEYFTLN